MSTFLFPVKGLLTSIDLTLSIGSVQLLSPAQAREKLNEAIDRSAIPEVLLGSVEDFDTELGGCVAALVDADNREDAVDLVETALDVLRTFLYTRVVAQMPSFGITDGFLGAAVQYADLCSGGIGSFRIGHFTGVHVTAETVAAYEESHISGVAGAAVGSRAATPAQAQALAAIRLASQALLTHDPGMRTVLAMTAAEVLLFAPGEGSRSLRLAQRAAFLVCGLPKGQLCGRGRPSCLILKADLADDGDGYKQLQKVEKLGNVDTRWRCSEWHHVLDWYAIRSQLVHEGKKVDRRDASRVVYWLVSSLLPAALEWYGGHPESPNAQLVAAMRALPEPPAEYLQYEAAYSELASRGAFGNER